MTRLRVVVQAPVPLQTSVLVAVVFPSFILFLPQSLYDDLHVPYHYCQVLVLTGLFSREDGSHDCGCHDWIRLGSQTPPISIPSCWHTLRWHRSMTRLPISRERPWQWMGLPRNVHSRARAMAFTRPRSIRVRRLFHNTPVEAGGEPFPNQSSGRKSDCGLVRVVSGRAGIVVKAQCRSWM